MNLSVGLLSLCLVSITASAVDYKNDFEKKIKASQNIGALGNDVAGDRVNFLNGVTSFTTTDISLPGNNGLTVALTRDYQVGFGRFNTGLGDWAIDIPYISTVMTDAGGWVLDSTTPLSRCTVAGKTLANGTAPATGAPPTVQVVSDTRASQVYGFESWEYWHGYTMHVPGSGDQSLIVPMVANTQRPATGEAYSWTTNKDWWLSCFDLNPPGVGQGFKAISPDGTTYWFDTMLIGGADPVEATDVLARAQN